MKKLKIGLIPAHRDLMDEEYAKNIRNILIKHIRKNPLVKAIYPDKHLTKSGLVRNEDDAKKVISIFNKEKPDALVICAITYGDEKSIFTIIENFPQLPILIFAIKENEIPEGEYFKSAASCGLIPISYGLHRRGQKFTFCGIIEPKESELYKCFDYFIRIANTVKKFTGAKIGMIGPRPNDFEICAINEGILLEKYKQRIESINLIDLKNDINEIEDHDTQVQEIIGDITSGIETDYKKQDLIKLAKLEVAILDYINKYELSVLAIQCWTSMQQYLGLTPCLTNGRLTSQGFPIACEGDVYGAISMLLQQELVLQKEIPLFLDILMQHPKDNELFLAWHCGNTPISCMNKAKKARIMPHCPFGDEFGISSGAATMEFMIKPGKVTINRIIERRGNFKILSIPGEMIPKEDNIRGAWSWVKVGDREKMYEVIINEGFTHHVSIIHEDLTKLIREISKYLDMEFVEI